MGRHGPEGRPRPAPSPPAATPGYPVARTPRFRHGAATVCQAVRFVLRVALRCGNLSRFAARRRLTSDFAGFWPRRASRQARSPASAGNQGRQGGTKREVLVERLRAGYEPRRRWLRILLRGLARWPLARTTARSVTDGMHRLCRATAQRPQNATGRNNGCAHSPSGNGCPAYTVYNA